MSKPMSNGQRRAPLTAPGSHCTDRKIYVMNTLTRTRTHSDTRPCPSYFIINSCCCARAPARSHNVSVLLSGEIAVRTISPSSPLGHPVRAVKFGVNSHTHKKTTHSCHLIGRCALDRHQNASSSVCPEHLHGTKPFRILLPWRILRHGVNHSGLSLDVSASLSIGEPPQPTTCVVCLSCTLIKRSHRIAPHR